MHLVPEVATLMNDLNSAFRDAREPGYVLLLGHASAFAPDLVDHVELVARQVVADPVARILGEPVFSSARIDVAADRVAHPERPGLGVAGEDRRARRVRASSPLSL